MTERPGGATPPLASAWSRKLGIRPDDVVRLVGAPTSFVPGPVPKGARLVRSRRPGPADVTLAFHQDRTSLEGAIGALIDALRPTDALWLLWPRRAGGHRSDLTDEVVRGAALPHGVVDVKVAAVDEDWSGLRFVVRAELRDRWPLMPGAS